MTSPCYGLCFLLRSWKQAAMEPTSYPPLSLFFTLPFTFECYFTVNLTLEPKLYLALQKMINDSFIKKIVKNELQKSVQTTKQEFSLQLKSYIGSLKIPD